MKKFLFPAVAFFLINIFHVQAFGTPDNYLPIAERITGKYITKYQDSLEKVMINLQKNYDNTIIKRKTIKGTQLNASLDSLLGKINNILSDYNKSKANIKFQPKAKEKVISELNKLNNTIYNMKKRFGKDTINGIIGDCC